MLYTVGEMATLLGVAPSTLRYYEKEGLLPFVQRSQGGMRVFSDKDYEFLKIIHCMKATGMPLKDIRHFMELVEQGDASIDARLKLFEHQQAVVEQEMRALQETLDTIRFKCWYYQTAQAAGTTALPDNMPTEALPKEFQAIRQKLRRE